MSYRYQVSVKGGDSSVIMATSAADALSRACRMFRCVASIVSVRCLQPHL